MKTQPHTNLSADEIITGDSAQDETFFFNSGRLSAAQTPEFNWGDRTGWASPATEALV
jgi:hypothetical protein